MADSEELISKQEVLELIDKHWDLFDGYTDQQTFKDLIMKLPAHKDSWIIQGSVMPVYGPMRS